MDTVVFRDKIDIFRVFAADVRRARRFFRQLKEQLKEELMQEEILIVEKEARIL